MRKPFSLLPTLSFAFLLFTIACTPNTGRDLLDSSALLTSTVSVELNESFLSPRPAYDPGTLVEYFAQTGDTVLALAGHFNTSVEDIMQANPIIPEDVSTLPAGLTMQIPIYYRAFWGSQYQILPDSLYPNGPAQMDFDSAAFVGSQPGWMNGFEGSAAQDMLTSAQIVDLVATNFSLSPRLLLALIEERTAGLSLPTHLAESEEYPLGFESQFHRGLYLQLVWAANILNNGYYGWRSGSLIEFDLQDGSIYRPDPWQNAASVALQYFYSQLLSPTDFEIAIGPDGFALSYQSIFGDPWLNVSAHIPGSLRQPELRLPFIAGDEWTHTGGPHTAWGEDEPLAALDFAPGVESSGCVRSDIWATAVADGLVVRTGTGKLLLDLDGDGDERTGWVIFYLHLEQRGRASLGTQVLAGQAIGHPSCEGGSSTGTHVHIARKYNGEWMLAAGDIPFVMENWEPINGDQIYAGSLSKMGQTVTACRCSDAASTIVSQAALVDFPTPSAFDLPLPTPTP